MVALFLPMLHQFLHHRQKRLRRQAILKDHKKFTIHCRGNKRLHIILVMFFSFQKSHFVTVIQIHYSPIHSLTIDYLTIHLLTPLTYCCIILTTYQTIPKRRTALSYQTYAYRGKKHPGNGQAPLLFHIFLLSCYLQLPFLKV